MRELKEKRLQLVLEPSLLQRVDDFRFANRIASQAAAVRTLIEKGLEASATDVSETSTGQTI